MADGKWIPDLHAETPLCDAARRVLTVRLEVVRDRLPGALCEPDKDPEHVHQLRVGTRRAAAALDIFACCLPNKASRTARKHLRRVRRAAGAARDWDVFLMSLDAWEQKARGRHYQPALDFLLGYALAQRAAAQESLRSADTDYPFSFDRLQAETVAAIARPREHPEWQTLVDLARPTLSERLAELDQTTTRDLEDYDNLHQVRIAGKRLRYAMEVFADCFARAFREELYPEVEQMQEILGNANDSHVAAHRLLALRDRLRRTRPLDWKRFKPGIDALTRHHRHRLPRERQRFLDWWQRWRKTGTEAALAALLKVPQMAS
jgi:CHAD domain-containing protein